MPFDHARSTYWPSHDEFCRMVDVVALVLKLDPKSPDIRKFKKDAHALIEFKDSRGPQFFLNMLSPARYGTREADGSITILEGNQVLEWCSIADWHCPDFRDRIVRIVVDRKGTRLYAPNNEHLLTFPVEINPHRNVLDDIEDVSACYEVAAELVAAITGFRFAWKRLMSHTETITVTRELGTAWKGQFGRRLTLVPKR